MSFREITEQLKDFNLDAYEWIVPYAWYGVYIYLSIPLLAYVVLPIIFSNGKHGGSKSVSIIVLGDLGHSPRMCYHARSFSNLEYNVNLCGYVESELSEDLLDNERIDIFEIPVFKNFGLPYIIFGVIKVCYQFFSLFKLLSSFRGTDYILIQNPPSLPILLISVVFIKLFSRKTKLIIDWHNLNYSILNLRYNNENHFMVRIMKYYEKIFGKFADLNLTVTENMKKFLINDFGIEKSKVMVVYDRPGDSFAPSEKLALPYGEIIKHEIFNGMDLKDRKILISSTSFTPDEDFNILLDALKLYDESNETNIPLLLIVTGKGPLKSQFLDQVEKLKYSSKVIVKSAWLAYEDYPIIMSIADVGISLHTSSSGLDLPMKILDFFGCGVPVISLNFPSITELVKDGENGLLTKYNTAEEVYRLTKLSISDDAVFKSIKNGAMQESKLRWRQNWNNKLAELFQYK